MYLEDFEEYCEKYPGDTVAKRMKMFPIEAASFSLFLKLLKNWHWKETELFNSKMIYMHVIKVMEFFIICLIHQ